MEFELEDKVAIVTGGSRGIGESVALTLAKYGANVVIADVLPADDVVEKIKSFGRHAISMKIDVTEAQQVQDLVNKTLESFGKIDILVNNAGVISLCPVEELTEEEWDRIFNVNTKSCFLCCKAVIPIMKKQGSGKIINIASGAGKVGNPDLAHYSASKFAVVGFTQALALELAEHNINVNSICPGLVYTELWKYLAAQYAKTEGLTPEATWEKKVKEVIPLGRPQTPEDIGIMAVFLASEGAKNITGASMNVSGGQVMH